MSTHVPSTSSKPLTQPIRVGVVGLGRMGMIHALHIHELAKESDLCRLACVSTIDRKAADTFLSLNKNNKLRIPFVQGKFNMGGTGAAMNPAPVLGAMRPGAATSAAPGLRTKPA